MPGPLDEFDWIASLRGLTLGDARALGLADDAAVLPGKPGFDLVISTDALVEGVHLLEGEAPEIIASRLLRTALSDLAAKAARPFGYLLTTAWPPGRDEAWRAAFRDGLEADGRAFGVALLGGDTVSTAGPLIVNAAVLGWVEEGRAVLRSTARAGDSLVVCGGIGDGWLGLMAARGEIEDAGGSLAARYRLPTPLLSPRTALLAHARAAADVSDGLLADAGHIAEASGLGVTVELLDIPLSVEARAWCASQPDEVRARLTLATGGDDYALVCAVDPADEAAFIAEVEARGVPAGRVGRFRAELGIEATASGQPVEANHFGWRHSDRAPGD
ncbi:MAG: thiamine-phosphate kinase [Caulobacteraceae bacterium]